MHHRTPNNRLFIEFNLDINANVERMGGNLIPLKVQVVSNGLKEDDGGNYSRIDVFYIFFLEKSENAKNCEKTLQD